MKGWVLLACLAMELAGCVTVAPTHVGPENENQAPRAGAPDGFREPAEGSFPSEAMVSRMERAQRALARGQTQSAGEQLISNAAGEMFFEHLVQCSLLFARLSMIMTHVNMAEAADSAAYYSKLFLMPVADFRGDDWTRRTVAKWMRDTEFTEHFEIADNLMEGAEFCLDMADDPERYLDTLHLHLSTNQ